MLLLVLGSVFLILIVALAAWALMAMTRLPGLALAAALLACGAGWFSLMVGWVGPGDVANAVLVLTLLTPAVLMAGRLADRVAVVRVAPPVRVRLITGSPLVAVCVCLNVLVAVGLVLDAMYLGLPRYTPPGSDALPLPAVLTVLSDQDQGCQSGFLNGCAREIDIKSMPGLSAQQTSWIVDGDLRRLHGWRLDRTQSGCRHEGWLLGREEVCVQVQEAQDEVQVYLESSGA